jgi:hypothetical protein
MKKVYKKPTTFFSYYSDCLPPEITGKFMHGLYPINLAYTVLTAFKHGAYRSIDLNWTPTLAVIRKRELLVPLSYVPESTYSHFG